MTEHLLRLRGRRPRTGRAGVAAAGRVAGWVRVAGRVPGWVRVTGRVLGWGRSGWGRSGWGGSGWGGSGWGGVAVAGVAGELQAQVEEVIEGGGVDLTGHDRDDGGVAGRRGGGFAVQPGGAVAAGLGR